MMQNKTSRWIVTPLLSVGKNNTFSMRSVNLMRFLPYAINRQRLPCSQKQRICRI